MQRIFHLIYESNYRDTKTYDLYNPKGNQLVRTNSLRKIERWAVGGKLHEGIHPDYASKYFQRRKEEYNPETKPKPYDSAFWFEAIPDDELLTLYTEKDFTTNQRQTLKHAFESQYADRRSTYLHGRDIKANDARAIAAMGLGEHSGWNACKLNDTGMKLCVQFGFLPDAQEATAWAIGGDRFRNYRETQEINLMERIQQHFGDGFLAVRHSGNAFNICHVSEYGIYANKAGVRIESARTILSENIEAFFAHMSLMAKVSALIAEEKTLQQFKDEVLIEIQAGYAFAQGGSSIAPEGLGTPEEVQQI